MFAFRTAARTRRIARFRPPQQRSRAKGGSCRMNLERGRDTNRITTLSFGNHLFAPRSCMQVEPIADCVGRTTWQIYQPAIGDVSPRGQRTMTDTDNLIRLLDRRTRELEACKAGREQAIATATAELHAKLDALRADVLDSCANMMGEDQSDYAAARERFGDDPAKALDAVVAKMVELRELLKENAPGTYTTCGCARCRQIRAALKGNGQ